MVYLATRDGERVYASTAADLEWIDVETPEIRDSDAPELIELDWVTVDDVSAPDGRITLPDPSRATESEATAVPDQRPELRDSDQRATADPSSATPPGTTTLAMRSAASERAIDRGVRDPRGSPGSILDPRGAIEAVIGDPGPPPPPPPRHPLVMPIPKLTGGLDKVANGPRSELKPAGGGTYRAEDTVFHAEISRDGRVKIEDKPNLHAHLKIPSPRDMGRGLEKWDEKSYDEKRAGTGSSVGVPLVGGGFDVTDWAMRASGQDPYYHRKKKFFDRTREERTRMARNERSRQITEALSTLSVQLSKIWAHESTPVAERRAILFQLWDECAEKGASEVVKAGEQARRQIIAFIRLKVPAGSPGAFTADELTGLNRKRQSKQRFQPY